MKSVTITIFVVLIVTILGLLLFSFQVRETESVLVTKFGKPSREITEPGWYFRWPSPVNKIYAFDSRTRVFETNLGETTTKGAVPIIVHTYVVWKIAEPLQFFNSVGTVKEAEKYLRSQLSSTQNEVIGQYYFYEFVNSNENQIRLGEIQQKMLTSLNEAVMKGYGIEIKTLGIKQLKISADVSKDVFERMKAERKRRTQEIISQGQAQAIKIRTDADSKKTELFAAAEARAKAIRGQGDAEAAKYYKMLEADPQLAMFLRDVEALKKILAERSTIVLSADTEPFKLLKGIPDIQPKK